MPKLLIKGVEIEFPFTPYDVQIDYMTKVIECLQGAKNGVLESPTGTGKTLCLLCASLGWLCAEQEKQKINEKEKNIIDNKDSSSVDGDSPKKPGYIFKEPPHKVQIIYASRTHTQLNQAVKELKSTAYATKVKSVVLSSRAQLCTHETIRQLKQNNDDMSNSCKRLVANFEASEKYPNGTKFKPEEICGLKSNADACRLEGMKQIVDIEDLLQIGEEYKCCPYYISRRLRSDADIIFVPYNYVLHPAIRSSLIKVKHNVVVIDEAHNIAKICEEISSLVLKKSDLTKCLEEVALAGNLMPKEELHSPAKPYASSAEDIETLKTCLRVLEKEMDIMKVSGLSNTMSRNFIVEFLAKGGISEDNFWKVIPMLNNIAKFLNLSDHKGSRRIGSKVKKIERFIYVVYKDMSNTENSCYKVHITKEKMKKNTSQLQELDSENKSNTVFNYYCLSATVNMGLLNSQHPHCLILTSGTLSPVKSFIAELGLEFPVVLENGHVIDPSQVFVGVITKGPDATSLDSRYEKRNNPKYIATLGRLIQNFSKIVHGGMLVFFPTYQVKETCCTEWEKSKLPMFTEDANEKSVFHETQDKETFKQCMIQYYGQVDSHESSGAILMAVCKGKVSEGLDFSDNYGRAVFITGLPYPPMRDPKIELKKMYLREEHAKNPKSLSENEWYDLEAIRPINQAIGRVIRHQNDYGAILMCDQRFKDARIQKLLPGWLRANIISDEYGKVRKGLIGFMKAHSKVNGSPEVIDISDTSFSSVAEEMDLEMTNNSSKDADFPRAITSTPSCSKRIKLENGCLDAEEARRKLEMSLEEISSDDLDETLVNPPSNNFADDSFSSFMKNLKSRLSFEDYKLVDKAFCSYKSTEGENFLSFIFELGYALVKEGGPTHVMRELCKYLKPGHAQQVTRICDILHLP